MGEITVPNPGAPFPVGAVLGGVGSLLGGVFQNASNARMVRQNQAFQERMSSTAYQRAVIDMKKAGLNPMLAYMQGGASSPGGGQLGMGDVIGPAISSAREGSRMRSELALQAQQAANISADTSLKNQALQTEAERTELTKAQAAMQKMNAAALLLQFPKLKTQAGLWSSGGGMLDWLRREGEMSPGTQFERGFDRMNLPGKALEWFRKNMSRFNRR